MSFVGASSSQASNLGIVVPSLVELGWRGTWFRTLREVDVEVDIVDFGSHPVDGRPIDRGSHVLKPSLDGMGAQQPLAHLRVGLRGVFFVARGRGFFVFRGQVVFVARRHGLGSSTQGPKAPTKQAFNF